MKDIPSVLLIIGIILVMLSTAYLVHFEKPKLSREKLSREYIRELLKNSHGDRSTINITYVFLGVGTILTIIGIFFSVRQKSDKEHFLAVPIEYFGKTMIGFTIARIIASALLIWALGKHPYDYYTLLRFVVCGATAYGTFLAVQFKQVTWAWIFGIVAVLFNPIFPIHLERSTWVVIDVCVAVLLVVSIFLMKKPNDTLIE